MQNKRVGTAATATGLELMIEEVQSISQQGKVVYLPSKTSRTPPEPIQAPLLGLHITVGFRYKGAGNLSSFREKRA